MRYLYSPNIWGHNWGHKIILPPVWHKPCPHMCDKALIVLTETALKNLKSKDKPYKVADQAGLYIEVSSTGSKAWRLKYRFDGKEKRLTIGTYPVIGLKLAREKTQRAKEQLANGIDPSAAKKEAKAKRIEHVSQQQQLVAKEVLTFEKLFYQWYDHERMNLYMLSNTF